MEDEEVNDSQVNISAVCFPMFTPLLPQSHMTASTDFRTKVTALALIKLVPRTFLYPILNLNIGTQSHQLVNLFR
jgi:hypothetical protein